MKLKSVKIHNYKCFLDLDEVEIADDVTCLVGMNETGKSAFLSAISNINPINDIRLTSEDKSALIQACSDKDVSFSCKFIIESSDRQRIIDQFGIDIFQNNELTIDYSFDGNHDYNSLDFLLSEEDFVKNILSQNTKQEVDLHSLHDTSSNYEERKIELDKLLQENENVPYRYIFKDIIEVLLRKTAIISKECFIPNTMPLLEIMKYRRKISSEQNDLFLNFIMKKIPDQAIEAFNRNEQDELDRSLKAIQKDVNDKVRIIFPKSSMTFIASAVIDAKGQRLISFKFDDPNGEILKTINFEERSFGFQYIISYLLNIQYNIDIKDIGLLLLDEPGIHLHPGAQQVFLKFIEKLSQDKGIQIVYSTHSPFMINKDRIDNIRVFESIDGKISIYNDIYKKKDNLSILPLTTALGYNLSDTMFVNNINNICAEGESDINYISSINRILADDSKIKGDFSYVNIDGLPKSTYYYKLLIDNGKNPILVLDNKKGTEDNKISKVVKDKKNLIYYKEVLETDSADVEDMFGMINYTHLMIKIYPALKDKKEELENCINFHDFKKKLNDYKKEKGYDFDNHAKPSEYLRDHEFDSIGFPEPELIKKNFSDLFKRINEAIP